MKKAIFFSILGLILIVAVLAGGKTLQIRALIDAGANTVFPPTTISSEIATEAQWETSLRAVGAMEAAQGVLITADIAGRISSINFTAGGQVRTGDLLVEQETSSELTQLEAAKADKSLSESNLNRVSRLYKQKLVSRSEFDSARAAFKSASARTETAMATLSKKQIVAPFSGRLGLRQVNIGQNISAGTPIVSLQAADPMLLNFTLPQQQLPSVENGYEVRVTSDAAPGKTFIGNISAINTEIDPDTRSVSVQATLANPDGDLLPGMFASVDVVLPDKTSVLVVPVTSISYASFGDSVFVIEEKESEGTEPTLVARQQFVQLGRTRGDFVAVVAGLEPGQRVASAGVFKLRNGAAVALNEEIKSPLSLEPVLEDN